MFWIVCAALAGIVGFAIAAPLLRRTATAEPAAAYDLRVYRDQLREVGRDQERGLIDKDDAERLRVEIGRKVLAADKALAASSGRGRVAGGAVALGILVLLLAGSFLLYRDLGHPQSPDQPIGQRMADAKARYESRPTQAEAEARAPKSQRPQPDAEYLDLIEKLRQAVAQHPDDPRGLALLAENEERLGNFVAAKDAQSRVVSVKGDQASADDLARLAGLTVEAAGGLITRDGEQALDRALKIDPRNPQARFMLGMLQIQNGRPDMAFPIWAGLLAEGPETAPWIPPIRAAIPDLAWLAGRPDYTPPEPGTLPGPDADAIAATRDMTPEARQQMIEGMVGQLETRLSEQGGTPEEWARLISSLVVLGKTDHARDILAEARKRFSGNQPALDLIEAAAKQAGLQ